jgi:hypothetical protein
MTNWKKWNTEHRQADRDLNCHNRSGSKIVHNDQFPPPRWRQYPGIDCSSTPLHDECRRPRNTKTYRRFVGYDNNQNCRCNPEKFAVHHRVGTVGLLYSMDFFWKFVLPIAEK